MKLCKYSIGIKFEKDPLAVEQKNYFIKTEIVDIAYELDIWPRNPCNIFRFKDCLFGATAIVKTVVK